MESLRGVIEIPLSWREVVSGQLQQSVDTSTFVDSVTLQELLFRHHLQKSPHVLKTESEMPTNSRYVCAWYIFLCVLYLYGARLASICSVCN